MVINLCDLIKKRPVILDGAMGTMILKAGLTKEDYKGHPGVHSYLNITKPSLIETIHKKYFEAGSDIILTNTFEASRVVLKEARLADATQDINRAAVKIAKQAAGEFSSKINPKFILGELGPGSKLPSVGDIGFFDLFDAYKEQVEIFLETKVDGIIISTSQDPLQVKAACAATKETMLEKGILLPFFVCVTLDKNGKMLLGTEILSALSTIEQYDPLAFGINCGSGPDLMEEQLKILAKHSPFPVLCKPNAGLPENIDGKLVYNLDSKNFAKQLVFFVENMNVRLVGGCCGTSPEYIKELSSSLKKFKAGSSKLKGTVYKPRVSSLFSSVCLDQEPKPFIIAEQTNVNGSKKFKDLLLKDDYDSMVSVCKRVAKGSHALDLCVAYAGRDEKKDITEVLKRLVKTVDSSVMIDSTNPNVIREALSLIPGRSIINSINLEDGGKKAREILQIARLFGAAVVCLTIDEKGLAKTTQDKVSIAKRLYELAMSLNFRPEDLFIDTLTLTLASGDKALNNAALQAVDAIRKIKKELKGVRAILGVSNISYGLKSKARKIVTSLFLDKAIKAGLDAAIINPLKLTPVSNISSKEKELGLKLIEADFSNNDPLKNIINYYENFENKDKEKQNKKNIPLDEKLKQKVIEGDKSDLDSLLKDLRAQYNSKHIINNILLASMREIGELLGSGKMPLPFVLQSAEVVRASIEILEPKSGNVAKDNYGTVVIGTVRGDVHDIGKNLVDIILSNNGFNVINLGIQQPISAIINKAKEEKADAIGLSGLLVSSVEIMREDLETLTHQSVDIPVLVGGAALNSKIVKTVLQIVYKGPVYYCKDAFGGLKAMEEICKRK